MFSQNRPFKVGAWSSFQGVSLQQSETTLKIDILNKSLITEWSN